MLDNHIAQMERAIAHEEETGEEACGWPELEEEGRLLSKLTEEKKRGFEEAREWRKKNPLPHLKDRDPGWTERVVWERLREIEGAEVLEPYERK